MEPMESPRSPQEPMPPSGPPPSDPAAAYQPLSADAGANLDLTSDPVRAEVVEPPLAEATPPEPPPSRPYRRRVAVPLFLFLLTCLSTFLAGATDFMPPGYFVRAVGIIGPSPSLMPLRRALY